MEAVIKTGGKQFYVQKGDIIEAEITSQDIGAEVTIDDVLLISDSTNVISDPTQLKSAKVKAKILSFVKGKKVKVFKPIVDSRFKTNLVLSHDKNQIKSKSVSKSSDIKIKAVGSDVIGIDEAQFFDNGIIKVCNDLANEGIRVIVAGLDMDYKGNPFGPMPNLMATAEYVTKVHAICAKSGNLANHSHRISTNKSLIHLGEKESYVPLSRAEFQKIKK